MQNRLCAYGQSILGQMWPYDEAKSFLSVVNGYCWGIGKSFLPFDGDEAREACLRYKKLFHEFWNNFYIEGTDGKIRINKKYLSKASLRALVDWYLLLKSFCIGKNIGYDDSEYVGMNCFYIGSFLSRLGCPSDKESYSLGYYRVVTDYFREVEKYVGHPELKIEICERANSFPDVLQLLLLRLDGKYGKLSMPELAKILSKKGYLVKFVSGVNFSDITEALNEGCRVIVDFKFVVGKTTGRLNNKPIYENKIIVLENKVSNADSGCGESPYSKSLFMRSPLDGLASQRLFRTNQFPNEAIFVLKKKMFWLGGLSWLNK